MKQPIVCWMRLLKNHRMGKLKKRSMLPGTHGVHCVSPGARVDPPDPPAQRGRPTPSRRSARRADRDALCAVPLLLSAAPSLAHYAPFPSSRRSARRLRRSAHRFPVPSQSPTRCSPGPDRPPTCSSAVPWHRCSASPFHPRLSAWSSMISFY